MPLFYRDENFVIPLLLRIPAFIWCILFVVGLVAAASGHAFLSSLGIVFSLGLAQAWLYLIGRILFETMHSSSSGLRRGFYVCCLVSFGIIILLTMVVFTNSSDFSWKLLVGILFIVCWCISEWIITVKLVALEKIYLSRTESNIWTFCAIGCPVIGVWIINRRVATLYYTKINQAFYQ